MYIHLDVDLKNRTETCVAGLKVIGLAGSIVAHFIDNKIYGNLISCFDDYKDCPTDTTNLFYTACDLLSLDYYHVAKKIAKLSHSNVTENEFVIKTMDILLSENKFLFDDDICNRMFNTYKNHQISREAGNFDEGLVDIEAICYFKDIDFIVSYVEKSLSNEELLNADVFRRVISLGVGCNLYEFYPPKDETNGFNIFDGFDPNITLDNILDLISNEQKDLLEVTCNSILEFLVANVYFILKNNMPIKRCKNCGKFFVAYNSSYTLY